MWDRLEQRVETSDAAALAAAWTTALGDPNRTATEREVATALTAAVERATGRSWHIDASEDGGALLRQAIAFCLSGSFVIE